MLQDNTISTSLTIRREARPREHLLPILYIPVTLGKLGACVDEMAGEQKVVLRGHSEGVTHEGRGVEGQGTRHRAGDTTLSPRSALVVYLEKYEGNGT